MKQTLDLVSLVLSRNEHNIRHDNLTSHTGPFSVNDQRAQVIEYTIPVYVDDQVALIPYKPSRNQAVLIKVFDWRIWLTLLFLTPAYIIVCGLSTRLFMGQVNWWAQVDFALRTLCMDSAYPRIPQERNYNKILSFTWIWGCFVLFAAYSGNCLHQSLSEYKKFFRTYLH